MSPILMCTFRPLREANQAPIAVQIAGSIACNHIGATMRGLCHAAGDRDVIIGPVILGPGEGVHLVYKLLRGWSGTDIDSLMSTSKLTPTRRKRSKWAS